MGYLVVPSDVTVLENKCKIARERIGLIENIGCMFAGPVFHRNYTKMDGSDWRAILTKAYDPKDKSADVKLCIARKEAVSRAAKSHVGLVGGTIAATAGTIFSLQHYNIQSRLIAVPFMAYAGSWIGRVAGDVWQCRNQETQRDRWLGELPAKVYYNNGKA